MIWFWSWFCCKNFVHASFFLRGSKTKMIFFQDLVEILKIFKAYKFLLLLFISLLIAVLYWLRLTHFKTCCSVENVLLLKLRWDSRFQRAFTACCCVFKEITLVSANLNKHRQISFEVANFVIRKSFYGIEFWIKRV